jgi:hypothetical protein
MYAPILQELFLLNDARHVICPESALIQNVSQFRIPRTAEIDAADRDQIMLLQKMAGGTYAYSLGFIQNGRHCPPRNLGRPYFVLMADAPALETGRISVHGNGLNVLCEDGHVRFICNWPNDPDVIRDNPFCNRQGIIEAGKDSDDAVVAPSYFPPFMTNASCPP